MSPNKPVTVNYDVVESTGQGIGNFIDDTNVEGTGLSTSFDFGAGKTFASLPISLIDDGTGEGNSTITVTLKPEDETGGTITNYSVGSSPNNASTTIISDDDGGPAQTTLNFGMLPSIVEGNSSTSTVRIPVRLNQSLSSQATVDFAVTAGTATLTNDYTVITSPNTLTFAANDVVEYIDIGIVGDIYYENAETFTVALSNASSGVTIATAASTGVTVTIPNDDSPPVFTISETVSISEGAVAPNNTANFVVTQTQGLECQSLFHTLLLMLLQ